MKCSVTTINRWFHYIDFTGCTVHRWLPTEKTMAQLPDFVKWPTVSFNFQSILHYLLYGPSPFLFWIIHNKFSSKCMFSASSYQHFLCSKVEHLKIIFNCLVESKIDTAFGREDRSFSVNLHWICAGVLLFLTIVSLLPPPPHSLPSPPFHFSLFFSLKNLINFFFISPFFSHTYYCCNIISKKNPDMKT